jgi:hypothetical protein
MYDLLKSKAYEAGWWEQGGSFPTEKLQSQEVGQIFKYLSCAKNIRVNIKNIKKSNCSCFGNIFNRII